jgi:hypothetical protein
LPALARIRALAQMEPPVVALASPSGTVSTTPGSQEQDELLDIL